MDNHVFEKVTTIIKATVQQPNQLLTLATSSKDVAGWDSLRHIMIISEVEKAYGIKFDFMEILDIKTIGDICEAVAKYKK